MPGRIRKLWTQQHAGRTGAYFLYEAWSHDWATHRHQDPTAHIELWQGTQQRGLLTSLGKNRYSLIVRGRGALGRFLPGSFRGYPQPLIHAAYEDQAVRRAIEYIIDSDAERRKETA